MKLYFAPGACSMSGRIALHEGRIPAEFERVDIATKTTEHGYDFVALNPKGYVPMLVLDEGESITENIAVLELIAGMEPNLAPGGPLGRTRLLEMLSWLSTELHAAFKPFWHTDDENQRAEAALEVNRRLGLLAEHINEMYLFGPRFTVADAYLFVMLRWALAFDVPVDRELIAYFERVLERPAVRQALVEEGLLESTLETAAAASRARQ